MSEVKLHLQDVPLQTSDNEDDFSDIEQNINDTSFQLQPNKNQTATSNFKSNFTVLDQHQLNPSSSIKSLSAKQEHKPKSFKDNKSQPYPQLHLQEQQPKSFENIDISSGNSDL
jgi:predicted  nucleic acid-binding Zn-ribbon protein